MLSTVTNSIRQRRWFAGAVDDGFGEFKDVLDCPWILQYTGYMHSYLRALRDISDQDGDVLLMEDDYHLIENRSKLMKSVEELDDDWKLAMLGYNVSPDTLIKRPPYGDSKFWQVGPPNNGNSANIYSPAGAADVLQRCLKDMGTTPECVIQKMVDVQGVYSRVRGKIAIKNSPMMGEGNVMDGRW